MFRWAIRVKNYIDSVIPNTGGKIAVLGGSVHALGLMQFIGNKKLLWHTVLRKKLFFELEALMAPELLFYEFIKKYMGF